MFLFVRDDKLWFWINNTKGLYKDMRENPAAATCRVFAQSVRKSGYQCFTMLIYKRLSPVLKGARQKARGAIDENKRLFKDIKG